MDAPNDEPESDDAVGEADDSLDKCRHGKTAAEYCEHCDNERIDLSERVDLTDEVDVNEDESSDRRR